MVKSIRLIARHRDPIPFDYHVQEIVTKLGGLGYKISMLDAYTAWRQYSEVKIPHPYHTDDGLEPQWVTPPEDAKEILELIRPYVCNPKTGKAPT